MNLHASKLYKSCDLSARENIVHKKFSSNLKLIRPYSDDKQDPPTVFYYPEETNDPTYTAESFSSESVF